MVKIKNLFKGLSRRKGGPKQGGVNQTDPSETHKSKIILPLYVYEPGVAQLTYEANQGIPTSSTKSESRLREGTGNIQLPSLNAGATANTQQNVSQEIQHSPVVMISDTRQKLLERGQLVIDPSFEDVEEGDFVEVTGTIESADLMTQTEGLMRAATLAAELIKTVPNNRKQAVKRFGITPDGAKSVMDLLSKSSGENPEGHLILSNKQGYRVRLDTDRNCFLRPINEHYVVSAICVVKRKLKSDEPPIPLTPDNVKPIKPLLDQLEEQWGNTFEGQTLLKELAGPCLIAIPVCIH